MEDGLHPDYHRIAKAIHWLETHRAGNPGLVELSRALGLSPDHTQKLFKRWAGITPKQFLEVLHVEQARQLLEYSRSVLDTSYSIGLSGPGRLHDQMVNVLAVSPGEYKRGGAGVEIGYGLVDSPFGTCLLGYTPRGICHLSFPDVEDETSIAPLLRERFPHASLKSNEQQARTLSDSLFGPHRSGKVNLFVRGTNFQVQVWQALLRIPSGRVLSYGDIARWIGKPASSRAVGQAVGANPIAWLIPCHRVIQNSGAIGNYRWGSTRKKAMLAFEEAHVS